MEQYKDGFYKIEQDKYPDSPRNWDNLGVMACSHKRYGLGDEQIPANGADEWVEWLETGLDDGSIAIALPLFLMDHSDLWMNTTSFGYCDPTGWDWRKVGYIYVTKEKLLEEYTSAMYEEAVEKVRKALVQEVETYSQYLEGDVWCVGTLVPGKMEDMEWCCGYYGYSYAEQEAKDQIDYYIEKNHEN